MHVLCLVGAASVNKTLARRLAGGAFVWHSRRSRRAASWPDRLAGWLSVADWLARRRRIPIIEGSSQVVVFVVDCSPKVNRQQARLPDHNRPVETEQN